LGDEAREVGVTIREQLAGVIRNPIDPLVDERRWFASIIGIRPSAGARSPKLWNGAFERFRTDAIYVPMDVDEGDLPTLVDYLRASDHYIGGNVTMPYKVTLLDLMDDLDPAARAIGAINTIQRTDDGRLIGYNTDSQGAVDALLGADAGETGDFLSSLDGLRVLLIGCGGAGSAVAFGVAAKIGNLGSLTLTNRTSDQASILSNRINESFGNTHTLELIDATERITDYDLVINATSCGQRGVQNLPGGRVTFTEAYSSLAPATPAGFLEGEFPSLSHLMNAWFIASSEDIGENMTASTRIVSEASFEARFFDVIYDPAETAFLRYARQSGHQTKNGGVMNLAQAVRAFGICTADLVDSAYPDLYAVMAEFAAG
jgi:shikimate dehydrogenase